VIEPPVSSIALHDQDVQQLAALGRAFSQGDPEARAAFLALASLPTDHPDTARMERLARGVRDPSEAAAALDALQDAQLPIAVVSGAHARGIEKACDELARRQNAQRWQLSGAGHAVQRQADFNTRLTQFIAAAAHA
jgi:hypothetical protein